MVMATKILLIVAWVIMILLTLTQYADIIINQEVSHPKKILAGLVLIIGAPVFCAYTALSGLLDYLLPEGWDDDNDNEFKR